MQSGRVNCGVVRLRPGLSAFCAVTAARATFFVILGHLAAVHNNRGDVLRFFPATSIIPHPAAPCNGLGKILYLIR